MANEGQTARLHDAQAAHANKHPDANSVRLGLVCAPELPAKIGRELCTELPELLCQQVDERVSWKVSVVVDPLTGAKRDAPEILDGCRERMLKEGWGLAVCLTDLPIYRGGRLIVADASATRGVGGISLPALGATKLRPRARETVLQLVEELYARIPELGKDRPPPTDERHSAAPKLKGERPHRFVKRRRIELVAPFRRVEPPDDSMKQMNVDARFAAPVARGHLRLLSGMVLANRPWKLFPSFRGTLAAAFATGAYVLVTSSIWTLADSYGWGRLLLLTVLSIIAMVIWIIVAHHLWERPGNREARHWAPLYNGVTALTITVSVLIAYVALFILIFLAALIFVEGSYLQTTLKHPIDFGNYVILTWMATSLATVAGALGSGLEDEDKVREATYGYRQRQRSEQPEESGKGQTKT